MNITTETLSIPGHPAIQYRKNTDHLLFSQTNYNYRDRIEIVITGWYHEEIMKLNDHIVAVWRVKKKVSFIHSFSIN